MITLKTLSKASRQEIFDQVSDHLMRQGEKCFSGTKIVYHSGNLKCALGCLISEEEFSEEWNVKPWVYLVDHGIAPPDHFDFLLGLQAIHDRSNPIAWKLELKEIAEAYNLKLNPDFFRYK